MPKLNENYLKLEKNYLFINIAKKINEYIKNNPDKKDRIIRMGIGDVTLPIAPCVVEAVKKGADEMGVKETFKGYEDSGTGYDFLKEAVAGYYKSFGVDIATDEIRISDGAKSDCGNIVDIFGDDNIVLITDPAYPVYVDSNLMNGRKVIYADSTEENGFSAVPDPSVHADIIYLCSPNNPTGAAFKTSELKAWIDYAIANDAVIIYDAAYEAFITEDDVPRSIFAVEGARKCAIEICSLSKTAGFTGMRCGYTVIPNELEFKSLRFHSFGADERAVSSTVFHTLFSAVLLLYSPRKVRSSAKSTSNTTKKMPVSLQKLSMNSVFGIQVVRTPHISGFVARMA